MKFLDFLKEAIAVLRKNPKLFVPKLAVAVIYGVMLILLAVLIKDFLPLIEEALTGGVTERYLEVIGQSMPLLTFMFFWALFSFFADIFVNAMYPPLISDFKGKRPISLRRAASVAKKRSSTVIPAALLVMILLFVPLALLSLITAFLTADPFLYIFIVISIFISLFFWFVFYYAYPVLVLENVSVFGGLKKSISLSRKNKSLTLKASAIPLIVSLFDLYLAFDIFNPVNFILFVLTRFLIAVATTYHMVLNPILYFRVRK